MKRLAAALGVAVAALFALPAAASAQAPSGAIFTTLADGSEVNTNLFAAKTDVYLDGGPGPGAPQTAAGLDDGRYVFQVTDPSGKTLLSQDAAQCRQFDVANGIITAYVIVAGCTPHVTGTDIDHGAVTIQLMPFADTPNHGGVYKVWAELVSNFPSSCLATVDCAQFTHGFFPGFSKTDNFKVAAQNIGEIDTQFLDTNNGDRLMSGLSVTWTDTLGAQNVKWTDPASNLEAHVEAPEAGTHTITIDSTPACSVTDINVSDGRTFNGPASFTVKVTQGSIGTTWRVRVDCN
jgi:hypothetical protein